MNIYFYKPQDQFYEFSNFAKCNFTIDNVTYFCIESYYQSQKFTHEPEYMKIVKNADSPMKAKLLGRQSKNYRFANKWVLDKVNNNELIFDIIDQSIKNNIRVRPDWGFVKDEIMFNGLLAKFSQNIQLKNLLLSTKNATIIENSPKDYYWGIGKKGTGKNMLGKLLMKVRSELSEEYLEGKIQNQILKVYGNRARSKYYTKLY
jgi:predicted NAD-dependent protein-ADP-ribosyltransferase YbiA (DUF1768 family)